MSKLILKRFQCVTETDEVGTDSPYFLTFVGDITSGKTHLKMTRQGNWENEVDQGEIWTVNETVAEGFEFVNNKVAVICGAVEEDEGLDVSSVELDAIHLAMKFKLAQFKATGSNTVTGLIRDALAQVMRSCITNALVTASGARDDLINAKPLKLNNKLGDQSVVPLKGDGGYYNVRYSVA